MQSTEDRRYKAVVFDYGGVLMSYGDYVVGWKEAEKQLGLPAGSIHETIFNIIKDIPDLDRLMFEGHLSAEEMEEDMLPSYLEDKLGVSFPRPFPALNDWMGPGMRICFNEVMFEVVKRLRKLGYSTLILTNNFKLDREGLLQRTPLDDPSLFDAVIESTVEGFMKPDIQLYEIAQSRLPSHITPEHCVFLDDLSVNCEVGRRFGWTCIQVDPKNVHKSIEELESLLQTRLLL